MAAGIDTHHARSCRSRGASSLTAQAVRAWQHRVVTFDKSGHDPEWQHSHVHAVINATDGPPVRTNLVQHGVQRGEGPIQDRACPPSTATNERRESNHRVGTAAHQTKIGSLGWCLCERIVVVLPPKLNVEGDDRILYLIDERSSASRRTIHCTCHPGDVEAADDVVLGAEDEHLLGGERERCEDLKVPLLIRGDFLGPGHMDAGMLDAIHPDLVRDELLKGRGTTLAALREPSHPPIKGHRSTGCFLRTHLVTGAYPLPLPRSSHDERAEVR